MANELNIKIESRKNKKKYKTKSKYRNSTNVFDAILFIDDKLFSTIEKRTKQKGFIKNMLNSFKK